jgi:hypothetical protein
MNSIVDSLASRKAVVIGFACAALLIALVAGSWISAFLTDQNSDTQEALGELAAYHAKVEARPAVEAAYKLALRRAATAPGLIHAGNAALAEAEIEKDVKTIASKASADVHSAQALSATKASGFETVAIEFDMSVPASRVRDLAYAVETHNPYYFVDDVTILAPNWQVADSRSSDPTLELRWTIRGYRWGGGS